MDLLVSDYDGTITDRDIPFIKKWMKKNKFALATGRYFDAIYPEILKKGIEFDYLICNDGAEIYDRDFNLLYYEKINETDLNFIKKAKFKNIRYNYDYGKNYIISINIYDSFQLELKNSKIEIKLNKTKILPLNCNKLHAIQFLQKKYNFLKIVTVGNDVNDLEMLFFYNGYKIKGSKLPNLKEVNSVTVLIKRIDKEEK